MLNAVPAGLVTLTVPVVVPTATTPVIVVLFTTAKLPIAVPLIFAVVADVKLVPVMVIA